MMVEKEYLGQFKKVSDKKTKLALFCVYIYIGHLRSQIEDKWGK